jgi:hypothetical protein
VTASKVIFDHSRSLLFMGRRKTAGLSPYWEANHRNIRAHMCDAMLQIFGRSSVKTLRQMRILLGERASPALTHVLPARVRGCSV